MLRADALTSLKRLADESRFFRPDRPVTYRTAHACLDVLGALNAESGGTLAQMPLPTHIAVAVQPLPEPVLRIRSSQIAPPVGEPEVVLPLAPPEPPPLSAIPAHAAWAAGIQALWTQMRPPFPGAAILIHSHIPQNAGQASSTALLAATALALTDPRQAISPLAVAQTVAAAEALTRYGDARFISPTHVIACLTCLHPRAARGRLLRYSAQPHRFVGPVALKENVRVLALDTGVRYAQARTSLEDLRVAAAMGMRIIETIYRDVGQHHTPLHGYLANTSPLLYRQYFRALLPRRLRGGDFARTYGGPLALHVPEDPSRLYRVRTAVDHLIAEHEHAEQFLQAMEELAGVDSPPLDDAERQRTLQRAGRLLLASHHGYRLRLGLSCREADWLVDRLMEAGPDRGVYGARITGAGGGGTVAALLDRSAASTDTLLEVMTSYRQFTGLALGITEA